MFKLYPKKLIIFGNGFDLWMGLPTKYKNYKDFISRKKEYQNCYNLFDFIERKLNMGNPTFDYWNNLEQGFYKFLTDNVEKTNEIINEIKNKNIDLIEACIEKNESIRKWIEQIRLEHKEKLIKLNEWYKKLIKQNYSFLWSFNYIQNWKGDEFTWKLLCEPYPQNYLQFTVISQAHGYNMMYKNLEFGYQLGFQLGASWQQISDNNKKYSNSLDDSLTNLINFLEIKGISGIDEWINSNPLFFLLLFCCKHKDLVKQLKKKFETSNKYSADNNFVKFLFDFYKGKNKIGQALYINENEARARPGENFYINPAYFPIDLWKQNNIFPDVYILGLNIDGQDKLYFVNQERSPIKLAIEHRKECYLSYSQVVEGDKEIKFNQYKSCSGINNVNIINNHVLEFENLAEKAFGNVLFNELKSIKEISN